MLVQPSGSGDENLRAKAARLAVLSANVRNRIDTRRMGAAVGWVQTRASSFEPLMPREKDQPEGFSSLPDPAIALGFSAGQVDSTEVEKEILLRAALLEDQVRSLGRIGSTERGREDDEDLLEQVGELAAAGIAIAYHSRGIEDPEASPFQIPGGLTLPAPVAVVAHAYSVANSFFW